MAMTALPLAFIVPAEELPADDRTAQGAVWSTVASLLQSGLGRKFSKFYPQLRLEQQGGYAPFGVVLGRAAPPLFRELYRLLSVFDRPAGHHTWAQACPSETPGGHRAVFLHGDGLSDRSAVLPYGRIDLRKAAVLSGLLRYAGLCQFHGGSAALSRPGKPAPGEAVPGTAK